MCGQNCNANKDLDSINNKTVNTEIKMATLYPHCRVEILSLLYMEQCI